MFENGDKAEAKDRESTYISSNTIYTLTIKCFFFIIHAEYEGGDVSGLCKV